jgi:hypothetical protein
MVLALTLAACAVLGGTLATYLYGDDLPLFVRLCAGASTGLAAFGLAVFSLALCFGFTALSVAMAVVLVLTPLVLMARPAYRHHLMSDLTSAWRSAQGAVQRPDHKTLAHVAFYAAMMLLIWKVSDRAMFDGGDGIYTGVVNNLGDLPFHLGAVARFVYGENIPPENPTYAGVRFTYPFLMDFVAAVFVWAGATFRQALQLQNVLLAVALVGLLHRWALELTRDRLAAMVTPALILLNGGLGWWLLVRQLWQGDRGALATIAFPDRDFTIGEGLRWGNSVTTLFVPQRAFLLGLPLAILVFALWWRATDTGSEASATRRMVAAGVVAGLLPLVHAHTFGVVIGMASCLALLLGPWRAWAAFLVTALVIALPQIAWIMHGSSTEASSFLAWHFGWDKGDQNFLWFWFWNTGLFIPLTIAGYFWREEEKRLDRRLLRFCLPFALCFLIPNLVRLSPWIWDNIKILFYWQIASAPLVAVVLARLSRRGSWQRGVALAALVSLTLSGGLDVWRVVSHASEVQVFSRDGVAFAEIVRQKTPPRSLILHAPTYNHPVFLTGRRSLMGYAGHLWSHGIEYGRREADVKQVYAGANDAEELLARYGVDYIVVGPPERTLLSVNDAFFSRFTIVAEASGYRLHVIPRATR